MKADPLLVIIQGENLSSAADLFIDGQKLPILTDDQKPKDDEGNPQKMIDVTPQPGASDPTFASQLKVRISLEAGSLEPASTCFAL